MKRRGFLGLLSFGAFETACMKVAGVKSPTALAAEAEPEVVHQLGFDESMWPCIDRDPDDLGTLQGTDRQKLIKRGLKKLVKWANEEINALGGTVEAILYFSSDVVEQQNKESQQKLSEAKKRWPDLQVTLEMPGTGCYYLSLKKRTTAPFTFTADDLAVINAVEKVEDLFFIEVADD